MRGATNFVTYYIPLIFMSSGFPEGRFGSEKGKATDRGLVSFKEMTLREHMALQLLIAMIHSENYHYTNDDEIFGEEKYAVDAYIAADAMLELSGKTPNEIKTKIYDKVHENESAEDDDDEEN